MEQSMMGVTGLGWVSYLNMLYLYILQGNYGKQQFSNFHRGSSGHWTSPKRNG